MNQAVIELSLEEGISNVVQEEKLLQVTVVLSKTGYIVTTLVKDRHRLLLFIKEVIHKIMHALALVGT